MAKEFKTIEQLVALLEARNVGTDEDTAPALRRESYYAIVNGYKDPFLDRDAMRSSPDDVYKPGTTFRQVYDLFLFDRELRALTLPYLLRAESAMKTAVVYAFCERNREPEAYLDRSSYACAGEMLLPRAHKRKDKSVLEAEHGYKLERLLKDLKGKLKPQNDRMMRDFTRHYKETYGFVPLWVLQNDLTFGNVAHFYQLTKRPVQNAACRTLSEGAGNGRKLFPQELLRAFNVLVGFRNICAHEERLYCAVVKGAHFDEMLNQLCRVLPIEEMFEHRQRVEGLARRFSGRINPSALNALYTDKRNIPIEFR